MPPEQLNKESWNSLLDSVDTVMLDCDGVLWLGNDAIKGSPEAISYFHKRGKRVIFLTNNSRKSRMSYFEKCVQMGLKIDGKENIITSSFLTADYLKKVHNFDGKVYIVGGSGIGQELDNVKVPHIGIGPDVMPENGEILQITLDPEVKAVVVGFDHNFSYAKLMKAASYLKNLQCLFIATNDDESLPESERRDIISPGAGCFVAAVAAASGRMPTILGKPNKPVFDYVKRQFNIEPAKTLMIGDNIKTDIRLARNFGLRSLLVLSGVSGTNDFDKADLSTFLPEYFIGRLGDILSF